MNVLLAQEEESFHSVYIANHHVVHFKYLKILFKIIKLEKSQSKYFKRKQNEHLNLYH